MMNEREKHYAVAIDGPSGAGKSTIARSVAQALGFVYVDTGAIYRTVGLAAKRRGIDPEDAAAVEAMLPSLRIELRYGDDGLQRMYFGTVVLPQADVKIFLTAEAEDRARRRYEELIGRGTPKPYEELLEEIRQRDYNDSHRAAAPLRPAEDAVRLDTTGNTFQRSRDQILSIIKERVGL